MEEGRNALKIMVSCLLVLLFCGQPLNIGPEPTTLDHPTVLNPGGTSATYIVISSPVYSLTADEVTMLTATLYDAVNNVVPGHVNWTASNGTITEDGTFYPWSAGTVSIEASSGSLLDVFNITVEAGVGQSLDIVTTTAHARSATPLQANLLDARGNAKAANDVVWTVEGVYSGVGSPLWTPTELGEVHLRARLNQMEDNAVVEVIAGAPYEFIFDNNMQIRSGESLYLDVRLLDQNGYEMNHTTAGYKSWTAENGTISPVGRFTATYPGVWNLTVAAGNATGETTIRVVPADASLSQLAVVEEASAYVAGESYELVTIRTDANGYTGSFTPPLENFTTTSGGLSFAEGRVRWFPGTMGLHHLSVIDGGVTSSLEVNIVHGNAITTVLELEPPHLRAGGQSVLSLWAFDATNNRWLVNGTMDLIGGDEDQYLEYEGYATISPITLDVWRIESSWYDAASNLRFESDFQMESTAGAFSFIELNGANEVLASDASLDLNPTFYDGFGNELEPIGLNWTVDGIDATVEMILADYHWTPTTIGGHEIRANADGIFATIRLTVVAGEARTLVTDYESGLTVSAGEASELFIQVIDAHGNMAPASNVTTLLNETLGVLEASPSGNGYWDFTGRISGAYTLVFEQGEATHSIDLLIQPGKAVRVLVELDGFDIAQGDTVLLQLQGVDEYGNLVIVEPENTSISCKAGKAKYVTGDTWELKVSSAGDDRSCTVNWNGLITQRFFDVEPVLLGGAVGSTNTAMTLASFMLGLILITLVVLVRRVNATEEDDEWVEDAFESNSELQENSEEDHGDLSDAASEPSSGHADGGLELSEDLKKNLAIKAGEVGVMQAAPGTVQGASGWYVDVSEEVQCWDVGTDGSWTRVS
jgi:hypothetical protein